MSFLNLKKILFKIPFWGQVSIPIKIFSPESIQFFIRPLPDPGIRADGLALSDVGNRVQAGSIRNGKIKIAEPQKNNWNRQVYLLFLYRKTFYGMNFKK